MGLQPITQMLMLPKILHLEPTDVCNLACPLCAREYDHEFNKSIKNHLTIEQIQQHCSVDFIKNLNKMFMCGNYGDPAAGRYSFDIYKHFRDINPAITLGMNTNGSVRTPNWWTELAGILNQPRDFAVFSIDGLADIISNAQAFIRAGGSAHWDMLVYKHNEHQVDQCQELARELGFKWFRAKVSKRPLASSLEYPINWTKLQYTPGTIDCHALKEQSIYIDAQGRKSPCCWLGSRQSNFITDIAQVQITWATPTPDLTCATTCTAQESITNFESQWQREVELCN